MEQLIIVLSQKEKETIFGGSQKWVFVNGEWIIIKTVDSTTSINLALTDQ